MAKAMDKKRFENAVRAAVTDADNYMEQEVAPYRLKSWMYWNGRTDLKAQPNRSKIVMTEVSDTVEQTVPQMMDMLYSEDDAVAFTSDGSEEQQKFAWQATQIVNHIFKNKNPGWLLTEDFVRDGLIAKTGVFKVTMREQAQVTEETFSGLSEDEFAVLASSDSVEVLSQELVQSEMVVPDIPSDAAGPPPPGGPTPSPPGPEAAAPNSPPGAPPPPEPHPMVEPFIPEPTVTATLRITKTKPEYCIETIAPEDFLINRAATSTEGTNYRLIGERRLMMVSDVVEMYGVSPKTAEKYSGYEGADYEEQEREQRQYRNIYRHDHSSDDPSVKTIVVYELYMRIDEDGDGIAELHKVVALGDRAAYIHSSELCSDHPYAVGTPYRIPHSVIGKSQADFTRDLQDINTQLMRQVLDNLAHVNNPRTEAVASQVEMNDLKDNRFGGVIRVRQPNMIKAHEVPFVAGQSMPILDYMDQRKEQRTGISKESTALDASALQSSSEVGVRAVLGAAQNQIKMMARTMCETGMKEMYRKVLALIVIHQDEPMQIRVSGMPMEVDVEALRECDFDVRVNVASGLGHGKRSWPTCSRLRHSSK